VKKSSARAPLALLALVFGVYLLTMSGHTYSPDEETMLAASWSLVETGSLAVHPSESWVLTQGVDGKYYSVFGPGQSVAAAPWVAGGLLLGNLFPGELSGFALRLVLASYNALLSAAICALLAVVGIALGYSTRASVFLGGVLAFATFLWPHGRTFFAEPAVTLCLLGSFYLALRRKMLPSGVLFAAALFFKVQYAVALPAFLVYVAMMGRTKDRGQRTKDGSSRRTPFRSLASLPTWLVGLGIGALPLLIFNWVTFGGPFQTGYGNELGTLLRTPLYVGVYGLLLSPGKGILWYAPPLFLALAGFARFWRRNPPEAVLAALLSLSLVSFFGLFHLWWGGGAWGPRFLVPLLPFALLPALPLIAAVDERRRTKDGRRQPVWGRMRQVSSRALAIASIVGLGFAVNLPGLLLNFDTYINSGVDEERMLWEPALSPPVGHVELLSRSLRPDDGLLTLLKPPGTVFLKYGFSYSEGDRQQRELLPRWTTGNGGMEVRMDASGGPISVTLRVADHRPPEMSRAGVSIMIGGSPVSAQAVPAADSPISTEYTFSLAASPALVEIRSLTWNPALSGAANRNEDIGVRLERIALARGAEPVQFRLVEDLPPPAYYALPRWYYDPDANHPADLWFVYLARTGMGGRAMLATAFPLLLISLGSITWGVGRLRRVE
jgi:hypothetical protein